MGNGLGIEDSAGRRFAWHWGKDDGVFNLVVVEPHTGDCVVVFTNGEAGAGVARAVAEAVLGAPHPVFDFRMLRPPAP